MNNTKGWGDYYTIFLIIKLHKWFTFFFFFSKWKLLRQIQHFSLRIHWLLIFANIIRCSRLWLWVGCLIYFKITPMFCYLMFLMDVFSSIKGINKLISKGMSNIYLKVTFRKMRFSKLWFAKFKKFIFSSVFGELQITETSLNFQISCCNLKIRGLGAKLCVAFILF